MLRRRQARFDASQRRTTHRLAKKRCASDARIASAALAICNGGLGRIFLCEIAIRLERCGLPVGRVVSISQEVPRSGVKAVLGPDSCDHHMRQSQRPPQLARAPASRTRCWLALERPVKNLRFELRCQRSGGRTLVSAEEARLPILDETLCPSTDITVAAGQCIPEVSPRSPVRQEKNDARTPRIFGAARSASCALRELNTFRWTKMPGCYHD